MQNKRRSPENTGIFYTATGLQIKMKIWPFAGRASWRARLYRCSTFWTNGKLEHTLRSIVSGIGGLVKNSKHSIEYYGFLLVLHMAPQALLVYCVVLDIFPSLFSTPLLSDYSRSMSLSFLLKSFAKRNSESSLSALKNTTPMFLISW